MITRITAPNPSPMTLEGTNGYVIAVGPDELVAIDPGIDDAAHIAAFLEVARTAGAHYHSILVTHGHPDHYPGALALRRATGAPVLAHHSATFDRDRALDDGAQLVFEDATLHVLHTPGHAPDHLVFWLEQDQALFTGDVVIGTGTVVVAPPSGDMRQYTASLERLLRDYGDIAAVMYGGHGPIIHAPRATLEHYIEHRRLREAQLVAALEREPATIPALVGVIYAQVDASLWPAAGRQVLAYLIALEREGRISSTRLQRSPTSEELAILRPDLKVLAKNTDPALARAELGFGNPPEPFVLYSLV